MIKPSNDQPNSSELERLFHQALDQPVVDRDAWLDVHCAHDPSLRAEVQELLLLDGQNSDGMLDGLSADNFAEQTPTRIGTYAVTSLLAHGGMSAVFDAVHEKTGARAAVKLIRIGMATARQRMRFQFESELLAKLNHPSISRLFDAGQATAVYADGTTSVRNFIAMEFVDGQGIAKHCETYSLSLRHRVQLMHEVARAVQHAHERGVIHRDLKPANILITRPSAEHPIGTPKVVDFGIAKLMSPGRAATVTGVIMGTLNYMSPEQMGGRSSEVGPASDVYALGAILYELLVGRPPIEAPSTLSPGAAFAMLNDDPTRIISIRADVPLDLDAIVHKAIERSVERRYGNARDLADDLERWLENRPVVARRPTVLDRGRLFFRRHPRLCVGVLVAGVSVVSLGSLATWQAVRASRAEQVALKRLDLITAERDRADEQARMAEAVRRFLSNDILALANVQSQADVGIVSDPDITLVQVLDRAAARVGEGRFADQPVVEAAIRATIGNAYLGLGRPGRAVEHLRRAADLNAQVLGPKSRATIDSLASLATATDHKGMVTQAIALFEPLAKDASEALGPADSLTLTISNNLALCYVQRGQRDKAATLTRHALALSTDSLGTSHPLTLRLSYTLALAESVSRQNASEAQLMEAIQLRRMAFGEDYPDTLVAKFDLGLFYSRAGDHRKALEILEPIVQTAMTRLGREHPKTLLFVNDIATVYSANGDQRKAADMLAEVYAMHRETLGEDHTKTLGALHNLAGTRIRLGELEEGSKLLRQAYEISTRARGSEHEGTLLNGSNLAETYRRMGNLDEAWTLGSEIVDRMNEHLGPTHRYTLSATCMTANVLMDQKLPEKAEPILRDGLARAITAFGTSHSLATKYRRDLAKCLDALGRSEEAQQVRDQIAK